MSDEFTDEKPKAARRSSSESEFNLQSQICPRNMNRDADVLSRALIDPRPPSGTESVSLSFMDIRRNDMPLEQIEKGSVFNFSKFYKVAIQAIECLALLNNPISPAKFFLHIKR